MAKNVHLLSNLRQFCNSETCNTFFHPDKTKSIVVATRQKHQCGLLPLRLMMLHSQVTEQVSKHRHLGVILDDQLKWQALINSITNTMAENVYLLSNLRHFCNSEACNTVFSSAHYVQNYLCL